MRFTYKVYFVDPNFPNQTKTMLVRAKNHKNAEHKFRRNYPAFKFLYAL